LGHQLRCITTISRSDIPLLIANQRQNSLRTGKSSTDAWASCPILERAILRGLLWIASSRRSCFFYRNGTTNEKENWQTRYSHDHPLISDAALETEIKKVIEEFNDLKNDTYEEWRALPHDGGRGPDSTVVCVGKLSRRPGQQGKRNGQPSSVPKRNARTM